MPRDICVKIRVRCPETSPDELVKITGSLPQLGSWRPAHALTLCTTATDFPVWKGALIVEQSDLSEFQYKYIIVPKNKEASGHRKPRWESFAHNRSVQVTGYAVTLLDVYGKPEANLDAGDLSAPVSNSFLQVGSFLHQGSFIT